MDALTNSADGRATGTAGGRQRGVVGAARKMGCLVGLRLRAAWRERLYVAAVGVAVGVTALARGLRGWVDAADQWTLLVDLSVTAASLAGLVLAVSVTVNAWFAEAVQGWGRGLLATAVGPVRWWIAHALAAVVMSLALATVSALVVLASSSPGELGWERVGRGGVAYGLLAAKLAAMGMLSLAIAAFSRSPSAATLCGTGLLLLGQLHPVMRVLAEADTLAARGWALLVAGVPDLTVFDVAAEWTAAGEGPGPRGADIAAEVGVLLAWSVAALWRVSRRD